MKSKETTDAVKEHELLEGQRLLLSTKSRLISALICTVIALGIVLLLSPEMGKWAIVSIGAGGFIFGLLAGERIAFILLGILIGAAATYSIMKFKEPARSSSSSINLPSSHYDLIPSMDTPTMAVLGAGNCSDHRLGHGILG